jgi:hypothetical protein
VDVQSCLMQANSGTGVFSSAHARMALRWCSSVDNEQAGFSAHDGGELNFKDCVSVADAIGVVVATGSSASLDKCELRWSKGVGKLARDADTFLTMTACDVSCARGCQSHRACNSTSRRLPGARVRRGGPSCGWQRCTPAHAQVRSLANRPRQRPSHKFCAGWAVAVQAEGVKPGRTTLSQVPYSGNNWAPVDSVMSRMPGNVAGAADSARVRPPERHGIAMLGPLSHARAAQCSLAPGRHRRGCVGRGKPEPGAVRQHRQRAGLPGGLRRQDGAARMQQQWGWAWVHGERARHGAVEGELQHPLRCAERRGGHGCSSVPPAPLKAVARTAS